MARELELWFWRVTDPATGRWFLTDMRMTARQALSRYSDAHPVPSSREVRWIESGRGHGAYPLPFRPVAGASSRSTNPARKSFGVLSNGTRSSARARSSALPAIRSGE